MVGIKKSREEQFSYLNLPRMGEKGPVPEMVVMAVEFMKYQGEVAYEAGKRQAIAISSTASTIGIGWSAVFFGITENSLLTSSIGLMMVFAGTYLLGYWTPRVVDRVRTGLDEVAAAKFYDKWLSEHAKSGAVRKEP